MSSANGASLDMSVESDDTVLQFRLEHQTILGELAAPPDLVLSQSAQFSYTYAENSDLNGEYTLVTTGYRKANLMSDSTYTYTLEKRPECGVYQKIDPTASSTTSVSVSYFGTYSHNGDVFDHSLKITTEDYHKVLQATGKASAAELNNYEFTYYGYTWTLNGEVQEGSAEYTLGLNAGSPAFIIAYPGGGPYTLTFHAPAGGPDFLLFTFYHIYVQAIDNYDRWCCSKSSEDLTTLGFGATWTVDDLTIHPGDISQFVLKNSPNSDVIRLTHQSDELSGHVYGRIAFGQRKANSDGDYIFSPTNFSFSVTVVPDDDGNTFFTIDGIREKTLTLIKGQTYVFDLTDASTDSSSFTFYENGIEYTDVATTSLLNGGRITTITIPQDFTSTTLTYDNANSRGMGGNIEIVDSSTDGIYHFRYPNHDHFVFTQDNKWYAAIIVSNAYVNLITDLMTTFGLIDTLIPIYDFVSSRYTFNLYDASAARPNVGIQDYIQSTTLVHSSDTYTLVATGRKHPHRPGISLGGINEGVFEFVNGDQYKHIYFDSVGWQVAQNATSIEIGAQNYGGTFSSPEYIKLPARNVYFELTNDTLSDSNRSVTTTVAHVETSQRYTVFVPNSKSDPEMVFTSVTMHETENQDTQIMDLNYRKTPQNFAHFDVDIPLINPPTLFTVTVVDDLFQFTDYFGHLQNTLIFLRGSTYTFIHADNETYPLTFTNLSSLDDVTYTVEVTINGIELTIPANSTTTSIAYHCPTYPSEFCGTIQVIESFKDAILESPQYVELCRAFQDQRWNDIDSRSIHIQMFASDVSTLSLLFPVHETLNYADGQTAIGYVYEDEFTLRIQNILTHTPADITRIFNFVLNLIKNEVLSLLDAAARSETTLNNAAYQSAFGADTRTPTTMASIVYSISAIEQAAGNTGAYVPDNSASGSGPVSGSGSGQALGDPYVYPMRTSIPVKLPNRAASYCLYQFEKTFINAEVRCATAEHQTRMLEFVKDLGRETQRVIADGYFFSKFFVYDGSRDAQLMVDLREKTMVTHGDHAFHLSESTGPIGSKDWGGVARNVLIEWSVAQTVMRMTVSFYTNPHIENGVALTVESLPANATGLLVHNYKPKLMRLRSLTTMDAPKLQQRLRKSSNPLQTKDIKSRAEVWLKTISFTAAGT